MKTRKHGKPQSAAAPIDKVEFVNEIVDLLQMDDVDRHRAQRDIAERYGVSKGIVNKYYREANFAKAKNDSMRNDSSGAVDFVPDGSDQALAVLFVQRCGETVRYIAKFGQWLTFDGVRWKVDEVGRVRELARKVCQEVAQRFLNGENGAALARSVASATKIDSVLRIVQADPQIAATHDQWDKDPLLLNTPGGVVDLRTREIRPSRPTDYLRKCTAVAPGWECNRWRDFLKRVTRNDPDTIAYLQRMAGYMLTGLTVEQAAFFAYGVGGNGKSKFLEAIAGLMGDYAVTAASSILMAKPFESHPTEIARLQNARLVISSEIGSGQRWNEAQLKLLTGGDRVTARYMRQDFFEFTPEFKLLIAANRKPQLSTVDEAIRHCHVNQCVLPLELLVLDPEREAARLRRLALRSASHHGRVLPIREILRSERDPRAHDLRRQRTHDGAVPFQCNLHGSCVGHMTTRVHGHRGGEIAGVRVCVEQGKETGNNRVVDRKVCAHLSALYCSNWRYFCSNQRRKLPSISPPWSTECRVT